jgi:dTDP-4-amino-4,6-dideoxygalactose transaminase
MREDFLIFGAPIIGDAEIQEVVASMKAGWLGTGPKVARFESDFAAYKGVKFVAALNSCTAALHLSMLSAGLQPGDEVITSPMTFCATVNSIIHAGGTPVLADVHLDSMNIDPAQVELKITPKTKALLPVHFGGRCCEMDALLRIAQRHKLTLVEDCAHAIESEYHGRKAGTFGDFGCFSFYVTKNIITGEGGMVIARREQDIDRVKTAGLHGMSKDAWKRFSDNGYKHYQVVQCGFKYNMMDLQAAIGIHQLANIDLFWRRRKIIWNLYNQAFEDLPVVTPSAPEPDTTHAYHLYTLLIDPEKCGISRDDFLNAMTSMNIGVGVHYLSIPEHPFYQKTFGWRPEHYPNSMYIGRHTVSLPISAKLTDIDVQDVIDAVRLILQRKSDIRRYQSGTCKGGPEAISKA